MPGAHRRGGHRFPASRVRQRVTSGSTTSDGRPAGDRVQDAWGRRTPYTANETWQPRVDQFLRTGITDDDVERWVPSACVLCSYGCGLDIAVRDGEMVGVRGREDDPVNRGRLGPKGLLGWQGQLEDRLTTPLVRRGGVLVEASWDEAMGLVVETSRALLDSKGPLSHGFYTSGQLMLEEYYTLAVIGKAGIGTPHMDGNTRLCTATAAASLKESFGTDGQPGSFGDLDRCDVLFHFGHNVAPRRAHAIATPRPWLVATGPRHRRGRPAAGRLRGPRQVRPALRRQPGQRLPMAGHRSGATGYITGGERRQSLLEPIPETTEAIDDYLEWSQPGLGQVLGRLALEVREIVPETVALSLTLVEDELTFTLATRSVTTAAIDAMQYLDGGPCEESVKADEVVAVNVDDLLDENRWSLFAQAAAAVGIRSSLSLPVRDEGRIVGGLNLYASASGAFDDSHEAIARLVGAQAEEAVRDADLSFSSRTRAMQAPGRVRELNLVDTAIGMLMARYGETEDVARERLSRAAAQGGMRPAALAAAALIELHQDSG